MFALVVKFELQDLDKAAEFDQLVTETVQGITEHESGLWSTPRTPSRATHCCGSSIRCTSTVKRSTSMSGNRIRGGSSIDAGSSLPIFGWSS
ncbi:hypothetical protein [Nocardia cyriacigeorgica]|uniref:hypothetical protein n=1 Tax=Nocardia cyriacigeorgica TaxID=135487 RepID=UPI001E5CC076|nr:hypothetical protein [Nocardia cyriacigeorgica]